MCSAVLGNFGSTVSAKSIFRVLAGGSFQCALFAASTSPVSASETIQERAVIPSGSFGAFCPFAGVICLPGEPSCFPPTVDIFAGGSGSLSLSRGAA